MTDHDSDALLAAQLRDVPLPQGLLARIRAVGPDSVTWSDEQLDAELRQVDVPQGLFARCRQVALDEPLDEALRNVSVPERLLPALREIPREDVWVSPRRAPSKLRRRLTNLALAASLAILLGGGLWGAMFGVLSPLYDSVARRRTLVVDESDSLDLAAWRGLHSSPGAANATLAEAPAKPDDLMDAIDPFIAWQDPTVAGESPPVYGAAGQLVADLRAGMRPWDDLLLLRYGLLGAPVRTENLPDLMTVSPAAARGLEPPVVRAFDRRFLLRHGVHPVVSPAGHEALRTSRVPLSTGTSSFELAQRRLAEGRWPAAADVRVEDFLAAVDYRFPSPPPGRIGLTVVGGPSIFGQPLLGIPSASLLQVGVRAGSRSHRRLPATHLIVALDGSAAMRAGGRFNSARAAVRGLAGQLGARDRLSLVVFRDEEVHTVEAVDRAHVGELLLALDRLEPRGNMNLGAGVQHSVSLALRNELDERLAQRVALIAPGGAVLPDGIFARLRDLITEALSRDVGLSLLEAGSFPDGDPTLARLAAASGGDSRSVASTDDIRFALVETLTGDSQMVAAEALLRVVFNPRVVAGYRLLGHEPNVLAGVAPARIEADLKAGQAATALYEIWLLPGSEDVVAQVECEWRDPHTGEKHIERQSLRRLEFATTFARAPHSLQRAALAAETAEVLRESYFVQGKPRSVQHVVEAAKSLPYEASKQGEFRKFTEFLRELEKVRTRRPD